MTTKLRYADFSIRSRSTSLDVGIDDPAQIGDLACRLLDRGLRDRPGALRLVGVGVSGLVEYRQLALDASSDRSQRRVAARRGRTEPPPLDEADVYAHSYGERSDEVTNVKRRDPEPERSRSPPRRRRLTDRSLRDAFRERLERRDDASAARTSESAERVPPGVHGPAPAGVTVEQRGDVALTP